MSIRSKLANIKRAFLEEGPCPSEQKSALAQGRNYPTHRQSSNQSTPSWRNNAVAAAELKSKRDEQDRIAHQQAEIEQEHQNTWPLLLAWCGRLGLDTPNNPVMTSNYVGGWDNDPAVPAVTYVWMDQGITFRARSRAYGPLEVVIMSDAEDDRSASIRIETLEDLGEAIKKLESK